VVKLLGEGGFGAVFLARDAKVGGEVALKVLGLKRSEDPSVAARFRQEALLARTLSHPHTIKVFDVGATHTGCLFMVMEYVPGESLADLLAREGGLVEPRVLHIAIQILRSLVEAHAHGVIHRDLKPHNVFTLRSRSLTLPVVDFGIASSLCLWLGPHCRQ
jgi:serine/threonine-protein kinase